MPFCEGCRVDLGSQNGPDSVKTKGDVMKFLKDSFI
jgi:hypothetical protein